MNKQVMSGTINPEEVSQRISIYTQTEKRAKMMLQGVALAAKYGKVVDGLLSGTDLMGGKQALTGGLSPESEIDCKEQDCKISIAECYDYSGEKEHILACQKCEQFATTRKIMD